MGDLLRSFLARIVREGTLEVEPASGERFAVGDGTGEPVAIRLTDLAAEFALIHDPELRAGELFMDGRLIVTRGSIYDLLALATSNIARHREPGWLIALQRARHTLQKWRLRNDPTRSRRNVAHHYDLDARLYALFLDSDRQYSCAYFEHPGMSLEDAQLAKKRHIAAKLLVDRDHRVLDIGSGWGGMALYLARQCGARVRGTTLSEEQFTVASGRAAEQGLADRVDFALEDFRETEGTFDRIVSIGMFEHVGLSAYDAFFAKAAALLDERGVMLLHSIGRWAGPYSTNPWLEKYIFPGGYIPALSEVLPVIERAGLIVTDIEILRLHYAETLRAWRQRFMARREEAKALYDERFCRMWEFYLAGSECAFRIADEMVMQIQIARRLDAVPVTRDYVHRREEALRRRDRQMSGLRLAGE